MKLGQKVSAVLKKISALLYESKVSEILTYIKQGHTNYFVSLLNIAMFLILIGKLIIAKLELNAEAKVLLGALTVFVLLSLSTLLGWLDRNSLILRKSTEKNIYWKRPGWKYFARDTFRVHPLHSILMLYEMIKEHKVEVTDKEAIIECLKKVARETIEWAYSGIGTNTYYPHTNHYCYSAILKDLFKIDLDKLIELDKIKKLKEVTLKYDSL